MGRESCDVAAGPCQSRDDSAVLRIDHAHRDDRQCAGHLLGCEGWRCGRRQDEVDLESYQFFDQARQLFDASVREPVFDDDIAAFDVTEFLQALLGDLPPPR
jgi:hypothetical protein